MGSRSGAKMIAKGSWDYNLPGGKFHAEVQDCRLNKDMITKTVENLEESFLKFANNFQILVRNIVYMYFNMCAVN